MIRFDRVFLVAAATFLLTSSAGARVDDGPAKRLTLKDVFSLPAKISPRAARSQGWLDGETWIAYDVPGAAPDSPDSPDSAEEVDGDEGDVGADGETKAPKKVVCAVDAVTGAKRPLYDVERFAAALGALPSFTEKEAAQAAKVSSPTFTKAHDGILLNRKNDLFFWSIGSDRAVRLTHDPEEEVGVTLSPDGAWVGFIHDYDLWVVSTDGGTPRALTTGGHENLLKGRLDWVYQEEIYGRGNFQAFWWSPDSTRLAFLQLDETEVPEYIVTDHRETRPENEFWRYPKAGDPNPGVKLGVVAASGGDVTWVDLSRYEHEPILIVRVGWRPDSGAVIAQVSNRIQTWLDVVSCNPRRGSSEVLFRDSTGVWIEPTDAPYWTEDGERFCWLSERDGFRHLYLYEQDGRLLRRLTEGEWEVDVVHGIDEERGVVWLSGDREDVKQRQLYRVSLEGGDLERVSEGRGQHGVSTSPTFELYRDSWSSLADPGHIAVHRADGTQVRVVATGDGSLLEPYDLNDPEFVTVKTRDGFELEAMMIKPSGFDPTKEYPVFCYTYSGPHAPQVQDRYSNRNALFHQMLAQEGTLIWICDNRSASGKGLESVKGVYRNLGAQELRDLEDGLDWLVDQGYVDHERIGLWGWSYGGYMTAYALTHSTRFKCGIAGAPVTDWRYYDTIYTERYMDTPQANPEGYASSSVIEAAGELSGDLLLIHGVIDENVHLQNTLNLALALQEAGKTFDLMVYPGNRHSVRRPKQRDHLYRMMTEWIREKL